MNYLYYNMACDVTAGKASFQNVNSITIEESIKKLSDTATIVLPREFSRMVIGGSDQKYFKGQNITNYIKTGDPVIINLGYDDDLENEFTGYISKIGADVPLEIECEDEMYWLRQSNFTETLENVKLLELLRLIAPGYDYDVIDNIQLGKFTIGNASGYKVLETLRKDYGLHSRFKGKTLVVGFLIDFTPQTVHYFVMNKNVRAKSSDLKFVKKEDFKVLLKAISINRNGKRLTANYGDQGGSQRTLHFTEKTQRELENLVEKNHKSLSFDGYEGKLPSWGLPRTKAGDGAQIIDPNYENSERDGKYLIESVTKKFNKTDGFLRENTLGMKI